MNAQRTPNLPPETRALMMALLIDHTVKTTWLLLNMSVSGVPVSRAQVKNARHSFLRSQRESAADDGDRFAASALVAPASEPGPPIQIVTTKAAPRRPLSFAEQMARVAAGARLVTVPDTRPAAYNFTLGGVASGMI